MSEPKFDIHISTSADTKGVEQAKQALAELSRETKLLTTASEEQKEAQEKQAAAVEEQSAALEAQVDTLESLLKTLDEQAAAAEAQAAASKKEVEALEALLEAEKEHKASLEAEAAATKKAEAAAEANIRTLASMEAELEELSEAMRNMDVASESFATAREEVNKLGDEIELLKSGGSPLVNSMDKARDAIQGVSDVLDGAEEGIQGVLGSLPGLVTAFGGPAGLVSGVGLATAALSLLIKQMSKLDYDGTWVGDFQEGFRELVTGMSDAEREARAIMEAPESWRKSAEEAVADYHAAMEDALSREIELLRERNELLQRGDKSRLLDAVYAERMFRTQNPNHFEKGTEAWAQRQGAIENSHYREGRVEREARMNKAYQDGTLAEDEERVAQKNLTEATNYREGLKTRETLIKQQATLSISQMDDEAMLGHYLEGDSQGGYLTPEMKAAIAEIQERIEHRNSLQKSNTTLAGVAEALANPGLAKPLAGETLEAAHQRAASDVEKREGELDEKTKALAKASNFRIETKHQVDLEEGLAQAQLKERHNDIGSAQFEKLAKDQEDEREGRNRKVFTMPDNLTPPAPTPPEDLASQVQGANRQLKGLALQTKDDKARMKLHSLYSSLNDGEGNQPQELAEIQDMLAKITNDRGRNDVVIQQAVRAVEDLQSDGSRMQQLLTQVLSGVIGSQRQLRETLERLGVEVTNLQEYTRR